MHSFIDAGGREWAVNLDIELLIRFEEITGKSLYGELIAGNLGVQATCQLAYLACQEEANKAGLEDMTAFTRSVGKAALGSLTLAVTAEINEFFPVQADASPDPIPSETSTG